MRAAASREQTAQISYLGDPLLHSTHLGMHLQGLVRLVVWMLQYLSMRTLQPELPVDFYSI